MLIAAIISGFFMKYSPLRMIRAYGETIRVVSYSLITIAAMLAIGTLTRFSGLDATLGLAFAGAGVLYPFFGTLLGWLGVADRLRHGVQRAVRRAAENHLGTARAVADPDERRQLLGRRHGQDDRRAIDRRRLDRDKLVRPRRLDPALCVLSLDHAGLPGRRAGHAAGLRLHRHDREVNLNTEAQR